MEDESSSGDERLDASKEAADKDEQTTSRLPGRQHGPAASRGEGLLETLPSVLSPVASKQQAPGVISAQLTCPGHRAAPDRRSNQEVPKSSQG